ncbi:polysaccharide deacetylase family protein [Microvirga sp. GCM10011540]|uniref:polysaccharide deacetylase family protein n=1 Tax=Microvirga sp. GCM10011540 TaxID=3317338 RepID=UPI00361CE937
MSHSSSSFGRQVHKDGSAGILPHSLLAAGSAGAGRLIRLLSTNWLTVICYHRVLAPGDLLFQGYKPTISATRDNFAQQMDFLRMHYNPISLRDLVAWLDEGRAMPPRPVIVTFDDGYRDNGSIAWPIMQDRGIPAVIFLATDHIGTGRPFIWDLAAYLFSKADPDTFDLPLIGQAELRAAAERDAATDAWVEAVKRQPGSKRTDAVHELSVALDVPIPSPSTFEHLYLNWSEVRDLARQGVEFGAHTHTHPILTSLPQEEASREIATSVEHLTRHLGAKPLGFAYPNGSVRDYSAAHGGAVEAEGLPLAFSLGPGPVSLSQVPRRRMAVPRVYVGMQDTMPRFIAKLAGLARVSHVVRPPQSTAYPLNRLKVAFEARSQTRGAGCS